MAMVGSRKKQKQQQVEEDPPPNPLPSLSRPPNPLPSSSSGPNPLPSPSQSSGKRVPLPARRESARDRSHTCYGLEQSFGFVHSAEFDQLLGILASPQQREQLLQGIRQVAPSVIERRAAGVSSVINTDQGMKKKKTPIHKHRAKVVKDGPVRTKKPVERKQPHETPTKSPRQKRKAPDPEQQEQRRRQAQQKKNSEVKCRGKKKKLDAVDAEVVKAGAGARRKRRKQEVESVVNQFQVNEVMVNQFQKVESVVNQIHQQVAHQFQKVESVVNQIHQQEAHQFHQQEAAQEQQSIAFRQEDSNQLQLQFYEAKSSTAIPKRRGGRKKKEDEMDVLCRLLDRLVLQDSNSMVKYKAPKMAEGGAMVKYTGAGSVVLYEKKKPFKMKVVIDEETNRCFKRLMNHEEETESSRRWWEPERKIMNELVSDFISIMHLVQGNRRFSRWKGSVVDSVIGAFLTQNVSDHLSSSAYMSLASRFPPKMSASTQNSTTSAAYRVEEVPEVDEADIDKGVKIRRGLSFQEASVIGSGSISSCVSEEASCVIGANVDAQEEAKQQQQQEFVHSEILTPSSSSSSSSTEEQLLIVMEKTQEGEVAEVELLTEEQTNMTKGKKVKMSSLTGRERAELEQNQGSNSKKSYDWESIKSKVKSGRRNVKPDDCADWDAMRVANVHDVAQIIKERGMHNILGGRIMAFLDRVYEEHGSLDLEWIRNVPEKDAKDFLLTVRGLGLKSVECIRLLTLEHKAFPVDVNVGRICIRLGWVPIEPLPEELEFHLLNSYPMLESIQKYIWPRLCELDQPTLYELHYQMITFGKVFCTKAKPNCNACPMQKRCKHFNSAYVSARRALPAPTPPENKQKPVALVTTSQPDHSTQLEREHLQLQPQPDVFVQIPSEPIIEEPPDEEVEEECSSCSKSGQQTCGACSGVEGGSCSSVNLYLTDIEECGSPSLHFNLIPLIPAQPDDDVAMVSVSRELMLLPAEYRSIPVPALKNIQRHRTIHNVYELPDTHQIVQSMLPPREADDPCFYLFAMWSPEEGAAAEDKDQAMVRGTLLIPCRTAMRGCFPLNGTYFQVNEVFADDATSYKPLEVPRTVLWNLRRRFVYCGTSVTSIFKQLTAEEIQACFWKGYVCVRGFDRTTRAPCPLAQRLHLAATKIPKNKDDLHAL